jgi:dTDP-4-dehydrorhamnose reductase
VRLLVTGSNGQVSMALKTRGQEAGFEVAAIGRPALDLEKPQSVLAAISTAIMGFRPHVVVNAAAFTAVDDAEGSPETAFAVNAESAGHVARAADAAGVPIIQLSTDYVFAGTKASHHAETDPTNPLSVYGRTKLAGEIAVARACARHLILRTAWVHSPYGRNFVKTMLALAGKQPEIRVVGDQWGNPTSAFDIADGIFAAARALRNGGEPAWGVYHFAASGDASWAQFASEIFRQSAALGGPSAKVLEIAGSEYASRAARPANSRLDSGRFAVVFGHRAPDWRVSLAVVLRELLKT